MNFKIRKRLNICKNTHDYVSSQISHCFSTNLSLPCQYCKYNFDETLKHPNSIENKINNGVTFYQIQILIMIDTINDFFTLILHSTTLNNQ